MKCLSKLVGFAVCCLAAASGDAWGEFIEPDFLPPGTLAEESEDSASRQKPYSEPGFPDFSSDLEAPNVKQALPPLKQQNQGGISTRENFSETFPIKRVVLVGNSALDQSAVDSLLNQFANSNVTAEDLLNLRHRLSKMYWQNGYVNSGIVPNLKVTDGVVYFFALEGRLSEVQIRDNEGLSASYVRERLQNGINEPLNVNDLKETLRILRQNPRIKRLDAKLLPGEEPGDSLLNVSVTEETPYDLSLSANNRRSPSVGSHQGVLAFKHLNFFGWGDRLDISGAASEGLVDGYLSYQIPLSAQDISLALAVSHTESEVIEAPFDQLDIESTSDTYSLLLNIPTVQNLQRKVEVFTGLEHNNSESYLGLIGQPYSFSDGADEGVTKTTNLRLGLTWIEYFSDRVLALKGTLRQGLDFLDANTSESLPDGRYTALVGQIQYLHRVSRDPFWSGDFQARATFQVTNEALLSVEKIAVGGADSVRGYRENRLVSDNGAYFSMEYHWSLFNDAQGESRYGLTLVPFFDMGFTKDETYRVTTNFDTVEERGGNSEMLSSIGLGLIWKPLSSAHGEIFIGKPLNNQSDPVEYDLQDDGLHYSLKVQWPFK